MKKIFTKVVGISLGLALASSAVAFVGSKVEAKSVSAVETTAAVCDFSTKATGQSSYKSEWTYDSNYLVFGGANNNAGWAYVTFGSKKDKAADPEVVTNAYVKTVNKLEQNITKVTFTVTTARKAAGTVNISLDVASDSDYNTIIDSVDLGVVDQNTATTHTINPSSGTSWGSDNYYRLNITCSNNSTQNGMFSLTDISYYHDSSVPVGTLSIVPFSNKVLTTGDTGALNYTFVPASGDTATITSATWTSSKTDVLSVSGSNYTAEAAGSFTLNLQATDSNGQNYNVNSETFFVSNELDFVAGDDVALVSLQKDTTAAHELTGINKDVTNHYGIATELTGDPGAYRLTVGVGELTDTYTFTNDGNHLYWNSGNTLSSSTTISEKTSWYVIKYDDHVSILNAVDSSREILMNYNSGNPRFACYQGNTTYPRSNLIKLAAPLNPRGSIAITSPTDTLIKLGDTGALTYSWTPNTEAPDATIDSITWTSSDSTVISVDNSTYQFEAMGPGSAKLSYEAEDSLGEVYVGSTNFITVKNKISGSYAKVTSISSGDTIAIVAEAVGTELSGIIKAGSNDVGDYVFYDVAPGSIYDLTVVNGLSSGTLAFETSDSKYLAWASGNTLSLSDEVTANSSWTVAFDGDGNSAIANSADSARQIWWNVGSPRFACYTDKTDGSSYKATQIYAPSESYSAAVVAFAESFLDLECDATGANMPDTYEWLAYKGDFESDALTNTDREALRTAKAVKIVSPSTDVEKVQAAMAKYDYIIVKYNKGQGLTTEFPDFINRDPSAERVISNPVVNTGNNNTTAIILVTIIAVASISSIAVLLVIKKRKTY